MKMINSTRSIYRREIIFHLLNTTQIDAGTSRFRELTTAFKESNHYHLLTIFNVPFQHFILLLPSYMMQEWKFVTVEATSFLSEIRVFDEDIYRRYQASSK